MELPHKVVLPLDMNRFPALKADIAELALFEKNLTDYEVPW